MTLITGSLRWHRKPASRDKPWVVHVNTTATGGGVAEILESLTADDSDGSYEPGWLLLEAPADFFRFTKNLHHLFHGEGDASQLENGSAAAYRGIFQSPFNYLLDALLPGDTVVLHDAQPLGLATLLKKVGVKIVWHCHIGSTVHSQRKTALWSFFEQDLESVDVIAVARKEFLAGAGVDDKVLEIPPAIDPRSPKNSALSSTQIKALLDGLGLHGRSSRNPVGYRLWQDDPLPEDATVVLQVSRWDPLKDMVGVLRSARVLPASAHLILCGPDPDEITDDPEGGEQLRLVLDERSRMEAHLRRRVHVLALSLRDITLNALRINALQRRADVVVQKSIQEGFGLTATEAMFKGKPVIATRVGGMVDQIRDGENGLLIDPHDDERFASAVLTLIDHSEVRTVLGQAASRSVSERYLMPRLLQDYRDHLIASKETI
jgi:trehalose synthase